ncbi:hypothetical protein MFRU_074g00080 [Monilinia fructicola]|nr:hypothetical protein MFRU_074g00080 [Monilinia fructicola]
MWVLCSWLFLPDRAALSSCTSAPAKWSHRTLAGSFAALQVLQMSHRKNSFVALIYIGRQIRLQPDDHGTVYVAKHHVFNGLVLHPTPYRVMTWLSSYGSWDGTCDRPGEDPGS